MSFGIPVDSLRGRLEQRYHIEVFSPEEFDAWADSAVRLYSRYNPVVKMIDIASVSDQDTYDLPDDCLDVLELYPVPVGLRGSLSLSELSDRGAIPKTDPSRYYADKMFDTTGRRDLSEFWTVENNKIVFVTGFSNSLETIRVRYSSEHILSDGWYQTIPSVDFDLIVDLIYADILESRGAEAAASEDYAEGLEKITVSNIPKNTTWAVARLRNKLIFKYSGAAGVQGVI